MRARRGHVQDMSFLGVYDGRLIEYDASTLAPLGLVVGADELDGRRVVVVGSGADECVTLPKKSSFDFDMQGAECASAEGEGAGAGRAAWGGAARP